MNEPEEDAASSQPTEDGNNYNINPLKVVKILIWCSTLLSRKWEKFRISDMTKRSRKKLSRYAQFNINQLLGGRWSQETKDELSLQHNLQGILLRSYSIRIFQWKTSTNKCWRYILARGIMERTIRNETRRNS